MFVPFYNNFTLSADRACCRTVKLGCHGPFHDIKNSQFSHGLDHDCRALECATGSTGRLYKVKSYAD